MMISPFKWPKRGCIPHLWRNPVGEFLTFPAVSVDGHRTPEYDGRSGRRRRSIPRSQSMLGASKNEDETSLKTSKQK